LHLKATRPRRGRPTGRSTPWKQERFSQSRKPFPVPCAYPPRGHGPAAGLGPTRARPRASRACRRPRPPCSRRRLRREAELTIIHASQNAEAGMRQAWARDVAFGGAEARGPRKPSELTKGSCGVPWGGARVELRRPHKPRSDVISRTTCSTKYYM
jgi:hypothetical protein